METRPHSSDRTSTKRHAVSMFYVLVFALAFGPALILGGPGVFSDTSNFVGTEAELATAADLGPLMIVAILSGPPTYALLAILMIALTSGKAGLRDLRSRMLHWRGRPRVCGRTSDRPALMDGDPRRAFAHLKRLYPRHHHSR